MTIYSHNEQYAQGTHTHEQLKFFTKIRSKTVHSLFYKMFDAVLVETPEQVEQAHRIRYNVFCLENEGYENPEDHKSGLEFDEYDQHTEQVLLIYKPLNLAIGTLRIIKPNMHDLMSSFPLQRVCSEDVLTSPEYIMNSCEFSRLCISKTLRAHAREHMINHFAKEENIPFYEKPLLKAIMAMAPLGLFRIGFERAVCNGLTNVLGVMEPYHIDRLVNKCGLVLNKVGNAIEYHGTRQPFETDIVATLQNAYTNFPEMWSVITNLGELHTLIDTAPSKLSAVN